MIVLLWECKTRILRSYGMNESRENLLTKKLLSYIYKDFVLKAIDTIHHQCHQCIKPVFLLVPLVNILQLVDIWPLREYFKKSIFSAVIKIYLFFTFKIRRAIAKDASVSLPRNNHNALSISVVFINLPNWHNSSPTIAIVEWGTTAFTRCKV